MKQTARMKKNITNLQSDTRLVINIDISDMNCTFAPMRQDLTV